VEGEESPQGGDAPDAGTAGYIASDSARLTSDEVAVTACAFMCTQGTSLTPPQITVDISAVDVKEEGAKEGGSVTVSTKINLRTY
jgi:hypothetical protein